jgi:hypothetical protein
VTNTANSMPFAAAAQHVEQLRARRVLARRDHACAAWQAEAEAALRAQRVGIGRRASSAGLMLSFFAI